MLYKVYRAGRSILLDHIMRGEKMSSFFHEAVEDYLEYCKEEGIEPHKSYSGSLNIRISPEVHSKIAILAKQAGISINAFIKSAVEKQVATML